MPVEKEVEVLLAQLVLEVETLQAAVFEVFSGARLCAREKIPNINSTSRESLPNLLAILKMVSLS